MMLRRMLAAGLAVALGCFACVAAEGDAEPANLETMTSNLGNGVTVGSAASAGESVSITWYACCGDQKTELGWRGTGTTVPTTASAVATPNPLPDTSVKKLEDVQYAFEWEGVAESEDMEKHSRATVRYGAPSEKKDDRVIRVRVQAVFRYRGVGKDGKFADNCNHICDDACKNVGDNACCQCCDDTFYTVDKDADGDPICSPWIERKLTVFGIKEITVRQKGAGNYSASGTIAAVTDSSDVHRAELRFEIQPCPPATQGFSFPIHITNAHGASNHKASISGDASLPADWVNNSTGEGRGDVHFRQNSQYAYATLTPSDVGGRTATVSSPAGGSANVVFSRVNGNNFMAQIRAFRLEKGAGARHVAGE